MITVDLDRAFRRREELQRRLQRINDLDLTQPVYERDHRYFPCSESVDGHHSAPNWRYRCAYCEKFLGWPSRFRPTTIYKDFGSEQVVDQTTLEPVDYFEREETWRRQHGDG